MATKPIKPGAAQASGDKSAKTAAIADWLRARKNLFAALAATSAMLAVAWAFWLRPLMDDNEQLRATIRQQKSMVEKANAKIAKSQGLQEEFDRLMAERKLGPVAPGSPMRTSDTFQMAGFLGERFGAIAKEDLGLKTYQVMSTKDMTGYKESTIVYNLSATIGGLYMFLDELGRMRESVYLQQLEIRKATMRKGPDLDVKATLAAMIEIPEKN
jgi:small-conductance mechanosensitive channel